MTDSREFFNPRANPLHPAQLTRRKSEDNMTNVTNFNGTHQEDIVKKAMDFIDYVYKKYGNSNKTKAVISDMSEYLMFNHSISMLSQHHKTGSPYSYQFCETFYNSIGFTVKEYEKLVGKKYEGQEKNGYIGIYETPSDTIWNRGLVFNKFTLLTGRELSEIFESKSSSNSYACDSSTKKEVVNFFEA